jgi:voltage-gated potassium channel
MKDFRFVQLLASLLLFMVFVPLLDYFDFAQWYVARAIVSLLFAALVVSAVVAVTESRTAFFYTIVMAAMAVMMQVVSTVNSQFWVQILAALLGFMFLGRVILLLLRHLFQARDVTFDTICASACTYILIGVSWAFVYTIVDLLDSHAFSHPASVEQTASVRFGAEQSATALYFSMVTLTTLGYGDITPQSMLARMLSTVEALTGQLYLAILVARLVGIYTISKPNRDG